MTAVADVERETQLVLGAEALLEDHHRQYQSDGSAPRIVVDDGRRECVVDLEEAFLAQAKLIDEMATPGQSATREKP